MMPWKKSMKETKHNAVMFLTFDASRKEDRDRYLVSILVMLEKRVLGELIYYVTLALIASCEMAK